MNKKFLFGMFAAAGMLLATSCQNDELDAVQAGNEATVSFTLGVEGGVQTRAISDGETANRLVYAVFDEEGNRINTIAKVDKATTFPATEEITLAKGQTYKVAFWAQNSATSAYVLDDAMNLTIDYTSGANNAEERDAFFKTETFTVTGNTSIDVVLKRPFAQINVGVTDEDWNAAVASGINVATSKVVIKNAATKMSLLDGSIPQGAFEEVVYDFGATPKSTGEVLTVDLNKDGTAEPYNYLSMSYILVYDENGGAQKATLDDLDFTFHPTDGNDIVIGEKEGLNSVPVQRNWRTNILGQLLTGNIQFKISIDPIYDGENNFENGVNTAYPVQLNGVYYKTIEDAFAAAVNGDVISLGAGEHLLPASMQRSVETHITLEGQGESTVLKALTPTQNDRPSTYANNINLVIKNLTYETNNDWLRAGFAHTTSVGFENCTIIGGYHAMSPVQYFKDCKIDPKNDFIFTYGATDCTFENCTFTCSEGNAIQVYSEGSNADITVNIKDCAFTAKKFGYDQWYSGNITAIDINSIQGNKFTVNISNCTETGFAVGSYSGSSLWNIRGGEENVTVNIDGKKANDAVEVNGVKYGTIAAALAAGATEISLAEGTYTIPAGATNQTLKFVGAGDKEKTVIAIQKANNPNEPCDYGFDGSNVTFENLTIEANPIPDQYSGFVRCNGTYKNCIIKNQYTLYGTSSFEDCTFHIAGNKYNLWTWGASAVFTRCTFNCDGKAVLVYCEAGESNITFTECIFNDFGGQNGKAAIETGMDAGKNPKYNIYITDCEVNGFDVNSVSGSNVWGNKNSMSTENLNVVIDNVDVY